MKRSFPIHKGRGSSQKTKNHIKLGKDYIFKQTWMAWHGECRKWKWSRSLSRVRLFATPWTIAYQAPLSMGFSRKECWSGLPFYSPGDLPDPGIEPRSPALRADALPSEPPGKLENVVQFSSVAQSCSTLCDSMNRSTPGLPVHHQLPEFTQTHVHRVSDAIQPSHLLSSPSPPALNPSQHQSLFQWVNSSHEVAKVLEFQL